MPVSMRRGQKCKLSDLTQEKCLTVSFQAELANGGVDFACFGVDAEQKLSDERYFIFYNQTASPEKAIEAAEHGTSFCIDLSRLPSAIKRLVFTVNGDQEQAMSAIRNGRFEIRSAKGVLADCRFSGQDFHRERAVILLELYEKDGVWRASATLGGFNGGLSALLAHFGGEETKPASAAPSPAPEPNPSPAPKEDPFGAPPAANPAQPAKISLTKPGEAHKINLSKTKGTIHANLNWNQWVKAGIFGSHSIDLDLACMYRLKTGHMGVVQALGNSFGSETAPPYIRLDHDDRTGDSQNGENMFFTRPELIELAVIFTFIYEGAPNWNATDASVTLRQIGNPDIEIHLGNTSSRERFCVIATLENDSGQLKVTRKEQYLKGHREIDQAYGFGFRWTAGRK